MEKNSIVNIRIGRKEKYISIDSDVSIEEQVSILSELLKIMLSCEKHNFEISGTWFENKRIRHTLYRCSICGLESKYNNL